MAEYLTLEEARLEKKIDERRQKGRGRPAKGKLWMKGCKKNKRSKFQIRNVPPGYASMAWDRIELGRK